MTDEAAREAIDGGRYLLVRQIASGGMGTIWEGYDTRLDRTVAIKEVSLDLIPPIHQKEFLDRAVLEGRNAAALADHPNIVTVHDVVIERGMPWTVMQFVRGRSLAELLGAALPVDQVAAVAGQMLSALGFAHEAGIIHRDVKPHNIMINEGDGRALLTDFGIAKSDRDNGLTRTGVVIGSAPYMAPERYEGRSGDPSSDLFSLGVSLFEAVEGYSPFAKETRTGTVTAILVGPLPVMRRAGRLAPLIQALTEKDPSRRPTMPEALALLDGVPTARTWTAGNTMLGRTLTDTRPQIAMSIRNTTMPVASRQASGPVSLTPPFAKRLHTVALSPDATVMASASGDLHLWDLTENRHVAHLLGHVNPVDPLVFSADSSVLAGAGRAVWLWDLTTGDRQAARKIKISHPKAIALSPDGRTLAACAKKAVGLWDVGSGLQTVALKSVSAQATTCLAFSPDGTTLAVGGAGTTVSLWDAADGGRVDTLTHPGAGISSLAFGPDGGTLAGVGGGTASIVLWDLASGHCVAIPGLTGGRARQPALFSPDGALLAAGGSTAFYLCDLATGNVTAIKIGLQKVTSLAFGPDNRAMASSADGELVRLWYDSE
ncbi:WD40 repeat domain-containing serine/threonine protein kinase [Streptomyces sp. NPDC048282]|uniref:WD40 repeat domain-containing serine/threonine protein kinase n=1 Tax=Streptomyces sp. NPDC048282 TaxID=3365528 RepID=UPI00371FF18A